MHCFIGLFGTAFDLLACLILEFAEFLFRTGGMPAQACSSVAFKRAQFFFRRFQFVT